MTEAAAIVITHNSEDVIGACLDSLRGQAAEIVVVDNASSDGTLGEVLRRQGISLIANPWNRGYAAAANQGIQATAAEFALLFNPDAELVCGLDALVEECREPDVAVCGGMLLGPDGCPQHGFMVRRLPTSATLVFEILGINRIWPGNPVNRRYRCLDLDLNSAADVEQPAGAFFLIRRSAWRQLGGLDEIFHPLWFEDVDFCKRARQNGYRIRFVPEARAAHRGAHSARQLSPSSREGYWYGNLLTYAAKHFHRLSFAVVCVAVVLGSILRAIAGFFRWRSPNSVLAYGRIIRKAGSLLIAGRKRTPGLALTVPRPSGSTQSGSC
jgi:hypothetical protein